MSARTSDGWEVLVATGEWRRERTFPTLADAGRDGLRRRARPLADGEPWPPEVAT